MEIKRIPGGILYTNTYIVFGGKTFVIDPGADIEKIEKYLPEKGVDGILLTHGHLDHIYNMNILKEKYGAKVYIHKDDEKFLSDFSLSAPFGIPEGHEKRDYKADIILSDGDIIDMGGFSCRVIYTPGHTPGGVCFYFEKEKILFSGDTVFKGSYGRTDFPFGSYSDIMISVKKLFSALPDEVRIYPGHGLSTTVRAEKDIYL